MEQKKRFIDDYIKGYFSVAELCRQFIISRKTGYKWINRYKEKGKYGLEDLPHTPVTIPHKTPSRIEKAILSIRDKHPSWGPKKILATIIRKNQNWDLPADSTVSSILKRNDKIKPKRKSPKRLHPGCPRTVAKAPNDIWAVDYKGQFKMRNGKYCYPLTVTDLYSRFLLEIDSHPSVSLEKTRKKFEYLFSKYGLPNRIRSDNGIPFASNAIARLSELSAWFVRLGIYVELIEPASPYQNGSHERMHRTLKAEATIPPERNIKHQQIKFNKFRREFNNIRPHEAIEMKCPVEIYRASEKRYPKQLPEIKYDPDFIVRLVSSQGSVRLASSRIQISKVLTYEDIAFERISDGVYNVYYDWLLIGRYFKKGNKLKDIIPRVPTTPRWLEKCYQSS